MARTGRFGRLPRAAPSLAATIVAMVREINAQIDSNFINAWENGGEVDGKPVTDQRLLDHFRDRRNAISRTDPLWDKWDQTLDNYTFSIAESKMTLKYAQHKVGEGEMAAFYRKWAGKVPTNSEVYRSLMRSAAQFVDAAQSRASSARAGSSQAAYNAAIRNASDRYEHDWDYANAYLLAAAYRAGILQQTDTTDPDDLMDLRSGDEADHARFMELFDQIQNDPYYADIKRGLREEGLGDLTYGKFVSFGDNKAAGINARIRIARQYDDESGAKQFSDELADYTMLRLKVSDIDEFAAYQTVRKTVDEQLFSGNLNPFEVRDVLDDYMGYLTDLRNSASLEEDRGFFNNEIQAMQQGTIGPTAFEMNEGGIRTSTSSEAATRAQMYAAARTATDLVNSGRAVLALGVDDSGLPAWSTLDVSSPILRDPTIGGLIFTGSGSRTRRTIPLFTIYKPIVGVGAVLDPRTGRAVGAADASGDSVIGVTYNLNGRDYYGIYRDGGALTWYSESPFRNDAKVSDAGTQLEVSLPVAPAGANAEVPVFDPASVLDPRALDRDLQFTYRYDSAMEAVYDRDLQSREALLRTSDAELQRVAMLAPNPDQALSELVFLRNNIVGIHNARAAEVMDTGLVWRAAREAAASGQPMRLSPEIQSQIEHFDESVSAHDRAVTVSRMAAISVIGRGAIEGMDDIERQARPQYGTPTGTADAAAIAQIRREYEEGQAPAGTPGGQFNVANLGGTPAIKIPGLADTPADSQRRQPPNVYLPPPLPAPVRTPLPDRVEPRDIRPREIDPRLRERENDEPRVRTPRLRTPMTNITPRYPGYIPPHLLERP